jgi:hypothetical protein
MGGFQHFLPAVAIGHVVLPGEGCAGAMGFVDGGGDSLGTRAIDIGYGDLGAFAREHAGGRFAQPLRAAGDERHFA